MKNSIKNLALLIMVLVANLAAAQQRHSLFDRVDYIIEPVKKINTVSSDIGPLFMGDKLYFSAVSEKYFNKEIRERKNKAFYNMYSAGLTENGIVNSTRNLIDGTGHDFHEGPAAYCAKTGELFITLSNIANADSSGYFLPVEKIKLRLAIAKRIGGEWQITEELPFSDNDYNFAHPAISSTGDTLIFSSDYPKGNVGGNDLFMSIRQNGRWSYPENLTHLNTRGDEMFPTIIDNTYLTFASNAHEGSFGGLDIYYTFFPEMKEVINLGNKINTHLDEFGLVVHPNQQYGYFASDRGGAGSDDIFRLEIKRLKVLFAGKVVDELTNRPIAEAVVKVQSCNGQSEELVLTDGLGNFGFSAVPGSCNKIEVTKEGYEVKYVDVTNPEMTLIKLMPITAYKVVALDIETQQPVPEAEISCDQQLVVTTNGAGVANINPINICADGFSIDKEGYLKRTFYPQIVNNAYRAGTDTVWLYPARVDAAFKIENILFELDKWALTADSKTELYKLLQVLNDNPEIRIELGSHTDSRGSSAYNQTLSEKRSRSVVEYLVAKGIDSSRLEAKGYGETQLINRCSDGVECSEEEHYVNRRTEFKIIK